MDANEVLARVRRLAEVVITSDVVTREDARNLASTFYLLDSHLSNGGTPPEVWREGPDAIPPADCAECDSPNHTTSMHLGWAERGH